MEQDPALPPSELLDELDVAAGVLAELESRDVSVHVALDLDRRPCLHASDRSSGDAWKLDPAEVLELLAGDGAVLDESRTEQR